MTISLKLTSSILISALLITSTLTQGECTAKKCVYCETDGTTKKWCTKCYKSKLIRTSDTNMKCEGSSTDLTGCVMTGLVDGTVKCIECDTGYLMESNYNCVKATKANCRGGTKINNKESCLICPNGFQPTYGTDGTYSCSTGTKKNNCNTIGSIYVGTTLTPYCSQCSDKYYELNRECSGTYNNQYNERCFGGKILANKGCSQCAYHRGFYAVNIYKGEQVCQLGSFGKILTMGALIFAYVLSSTF